MRLQRHIFQPTWPICCNQWVVHWDMRITANEQNICQTLSLYYLISISTKVSQLITLSKGVFSCHIVFKLLIPIAKKQKRRGRYIHVNSYCSQEAKAQRLFRYYLWFEGVFTSVNKQTVKFNDMCLVLVNGTVGFVKSAALSTASWVTGAKLESP